MYKLALVAQQYWGYIKQKWGLIFITIFLKWKPQIFVHLNWDLIVSDAAILQTLLNANANSDHAIYQAVLKNQAYIVGHSSI